MKRAFVIFLVIAILLISVVYAGLDAKDGKVINVATPTVATDAANKQYVDDTSGLAGSDAPLMATSAGTLGSIKYDSDYIYVYVAANSWKRAALSTWLTTMIYEDGNTMIYEDGNTMVYE